MCHFSIADLPRFGDKPKHLLNAFNGQRNRIFRRSGVIEAEDGDAEPLR